MLNNYGADLVVIAGRLARYHGILEVPVRADMPPEVRERFDRETHEILSDLSETLPKIEELARFLDMASVSAQAGTLRALLTDSYYLTPQQTFAYETQQLLRRLREVLEARWFYYVPFSAVGFYQNPRIFGDDFAEAFPSAVFDSVEAARCLALGRSTACVLHLMRVLDGCFQKGLNPWLGIKPSPSWGGYIQAIKAVLSAKPMPKRVRSKRDRAFATKTVEHIHSIKEAWRNPSTHEADQHYSDEDAAAILIVVKRFVQHLATRVREPRPRRR